MTTAGRTMPKTLLWTGCAWIALVAHATTVGRAADGPGSGAVEEQPVPAARAVVGPGQMPSVPKALSRPEGWPRGRSDEVTGTDNHVLSSIRPDPGAPLVPLEPADLTSVPNKPGSGTVVQAGFEEKLPAGGGQGAVGTLDSARVIARVGPEVVLEGDLLTPSALAWLEKVSGGLTQEQIRELKTQICRQVVKQHVESLIVYVDACRTIPEDRLPEIEKKVNEAFDQQQLPRLVKEAGLNSGTEYEHLLRSRGQSLDRIRKTYFERALAQQWIQQKVVSDGEIPHAEMIAWYQGHLADYEYPARARFEQLTVKISPSRPRPRAWDALAAMGNEVLQGRPFAEVARARSEGPTAAQGGGYDWTTRGSLVAKVVDDAVFSLPVGQLSTILDDGSALHIVRVIERTDAGRTPFIEAQVGIREKLSEERRQRQVEDYLSTLRSRTPVWTIFDQDIAQGPAQGGSATATRPKQTSTR